MSTRDCVELDRTTQSDCDVTSQVDLTNGEYSIIVLSLRSTTPSCNGCTRSFRQTHSKDISYIYGCPKS
jgi:hypothetical protein